MEPKVVKQNVKAKRIGDSFYVLLDKSIRSQLIIEDDIVLGAKLWNINKEVIQCPGCKYEFNDFIGTDPHDCPDCGKEFLDTYAIKINTPEEDIQLKGGIKKSA